MSQRVNLREIGTTLKTQAIVLGGFVLLFWAIEIIDQFVIGFLFGGSLDYLGVRPRSWEGLRGILFGPFLHVDFGHVLANTVPFLVLGWFVMINGLAQFGAVTAVVAVVSGLGTWLIAPGNSIHIGASGIIFGYFGYLLLRGYFERSFGAILWSLIVVFLYGGLIWGVLPQGYGISWQGHLFGFIGGGYAAYLLSSHREALSGNDEFDIHFLDE